MAKLSKKAQRALRSSLRQPFTTQPLDAELSIVENTQAGRLRYIQFATEAAKIVRGKKPIGIHGNNWKL